MSRRFRLVISGAFALLAIVLFAPPMRSMCARRRRACAQTPSARYGGEVVSLVVADDAIEEGRHRLLQRLRARVARRPGPRGRRHERR